VQTLEFAPSRRDTVLVVDDTPETLSLLTDTLDQEGFTVLIATDGEAALDLLDQITPDLVLMDALMPGISGFETCKRLKRDKMMAHLPVIFMTGLAETENVIEGLASGGVDYVTKPIVLEVLLARIRVHLGNARLAHDTHAALDASGRFLFATDRAGRVLWCTPKARQLLNDSAARLTPEPTLPATVIEQLLRVRHADSHGAVRCTFTMAERRLECSFLSTLGSNELLFRLAEGGHNDADKGILQRAHLLTSREAEVLLWISRGKSNRDIGQILDISPRTVNKHLEQVFVKLGVENRAAAAAVAVRTLTR
jgi:DNA-binding response OmpR family regulator/DNA-binding CsgD family transcriptional regulator